MNAKPSFTPRRNSKPKQSGSKLQSEALFDNEKLLLPFLEQSPHAALFTDESGTIRVWNHACEDITGLSRNKAVGKPSWEVFYQLALPEQRTSECLESIKAAILEALETGQSPCFGDGWESVILSRSGERRLVQILPLPIRTSTGTCIAMTARDLTKQRQEEVKAQESEARYRTLFEGANDAILVLENNRFIDCNLRTLALFGYSKEELIGKTPYAVSPKTQSDRSSSKKKALEKIRLSMEGKPQFFEWQHLRRDGTVFEVELSLNCVPSSGRKYILGVVRDITERKRAEEKLKENEEQIHTILQNSPTGIVMVDDAFRFCHVNDESCRIVGYGREELLDREFTLLIDEDSKDQVIDRFRRRQNGEDVPVRHEYNILRKNGQKRRVEMIAAVIRNKAGRPFTIAHIEDITEKRQVESKVHWRNLELEAIAKISSAMRTAQNRTEIYSILVEQSTELFKVSGGGGALVSYDPTNDKSNVEVSSPAWPNWIDSFNPSFKEISERVLKSGQAYRGELNVNVTSAELKSKVVNGICTPLIASAQVVGALWIVRTEPFNEEDLHLLTAISDMTANAIHRQTLHEDLLIQIENLRQTQARLVQSEKLAAIGQLVSGVAHELNNPLTSVVLYSQLVQQEIQDPLPKQNMAKVVAEAMRAGKIVRGLLDFARQRPIKREPVAVNTILTSSLDLVSYELLSRKITVALNLASDLPLILADPHQLQQVFINLLQNAWQAISVARAEGQIVIQTDVTPSIFETSESVENKVVRIQIQDNGPGISTEILNRIFDPFFTTKPEGEGTGLGLSVCHGIVAGHGGHIWAESLPGAQTTFTIELPISPLDAIDNKENAVGVLPTHSGEKGKVLIIDDEPNVKDVLAQALRKRGYQVDAVSNGTDGLELLAQSAYSHILCDIRMPGLTGVEFYQLLKAKDPELTGRIIFITGDTTNDFTRRFIDENNVHCLAKPFEMNELFQAILEIEKGRE